MRLAQAINEASRRELFDLASYLHAELEMENIDQGRDDGPVEVSAKSVADAIADWAHMQLNPRARGD